LICLERLYLNDKTKVPLLPPSLWQLKDLRFLRLKQDFSTLVPNGNPGFILTPPCIEKLTGLMCFNIDCVCLPKHLREDLCKLLLRLVKRCRWLGSLSVDDPDFTKDWLTTGTENGTQFGFALACNRARYRTGCRDRILGAEKTGRRGPPKTAWPHVLARPHRAFARYEDDEHFYGFMLEDWFSIGEPQAIYQLVREPFLEVLLGRSERLQGAKGA